MNKTDLEKRVFAATRDYGMSQVLLRNTTSRKLGLNVTDMECLSLLAMKGIATPTELARYTGMTTGSATAMLDRLEKAKLIRRKPNPNDRRGVLIEINKDSMAEIGALYTGVQQALGKLIAGYSDKELEIIADFLARFTADMQTHIKKLETDQI